MTLVGGATVWRRKVHELVDFLLPGACLGCARRLPQAVADALVCQACLTRLRRPAPPLCERCGMPLGTGVRSRDGCLECARWPSAVGWARSTYELRAPADALVHGLKYGGWHRLALVMGARMAGSGIPAHLDSTTRIVPVPTTRKRERHRGYNQARLLARVVSQRRGFQLVDALERPGRAVTQVALHPAQRRANVQSAFRFRPEARALVEGSRVVLVDDVLTTGATAGAAARVLQEAGATDVGVVTFARALPFRTSSD